MLTHDTPNNILKDSNYCFGSLAIKLWSKDLKTPYPKNRITRITGLVYLKEKYR